jgi:hypothetical protein
MMADVVALGEGEEIITTIRRHWFNLAIEGIVDIFIFFVIAVVIIGVDSFALFGEFSLDSGKIIPLGFFFLGFIGLLLWMHFFTSWSDHWLDVWVITNKRVIDIEQHGFFRREVSSFQIDKIQDITCTVSGIIPTWLHFGDIRIQTASISKDLIMKQIPFPEDIKEHLISIVEHYGKKNDA